MDGPPPNRPDDDDLDLDALAAELRRQAAARPTAARPFEHHAVAASLEEVRRRLEVGAGAPELPRFRGPVRVLARLLARAVLYGLRFLTNRLRQLHHAQYNALHQIDRRIQELEARHQRELRALRAEVAELTRALQQQRRRAA
jgi:hypothetical protein